MYPEAMVTRAVGDASALGELAHQHRTDLMLAAELRRQALRLPAPSRRRTARPGVPGWLRWFRQQIHVRPTSTLVGCGLPEAD